MKLVQLRNLHTMLPQGRRRNLTAEDVFFLHGEVNRTCDIYLDELREALGIVCGADVSIPTIWRTLRNGGFRMKKLTRNAIERSTTKRARYILKTLVSTLDSIPLSHTLQPSCGAFSWL
ncbi:hypothetical protein BDQ17DRAFT_1370103 [Cyathus striatus]|nr:hypothetical protein BDQ17DRAFT_1370103 [Cyathus striatus]